jgi:hypothetical protein
VASKIHGSPFVCLSFIPLLAVFSSSVSLFYTPPYSTPSAPCCMFSSTSELPVLPPACFPPLYPTVSPPCLIFHKPHECPASSSFFFNPPATLPSVPICRVTLLSNQYFRLVRLVSDSPFSSQPTYTPSLYFLVLVAVLRLLP